MSTLVGAAGLVGAGVLGGGALAGVTAEAAARVRIRTRGGYHVLRRWSRTEMALDREVLPRLEEVVRIEANRDGERGPEPPRRWEDTYRVLVAGGSAAECYLLDQESEWPAVVRRRLNRDPASLGAGAVHVGSVARSLVPCEAIETILRRVLPRYPRLDLVVLMIGASDVVAWLERGTPPEIEEGVYDTARVFAEHPEGPFGWHPRALALRQLASSWHRRLLRPVDRREGVGGRIARSRAMRARGAFLHEVADPTPMVASFERWLRRSIETARARASRVLVVRQPWLRRDFTAEEELELWNFADGRPYVEECSRYYDHDVVNRLMSLVEQASGRVADECGVEQLGLMDVVAHDFEHFYDRLHFTPAGARIVGEAVAEAILAGARDAVPSVAR